ncbi:MAG: hypothetical protein JO182_31240, partial [Acidobacteriaceae bacterium]|nr:hypothetical protein [Acidobacteriaceae bacterium]
LHTPKEAHIVGSLQRPAEPPSIVAGERRAIRHAGEDVGAIHSVTKFVATYLGML